MTVANARNIRIDGILLIAHEVKLKEEILNRLLSVKQSVASLNSHGNMFEGLIHRITTRPGIIKNIHNSYIAKESSAKPKTYNPLNKHGNTFQGLPHGGITRPGLIQNIHQPDIAKEISAKPPMYNPLNRHGNTFQGLPHGGTTRPGVIQNIHQPEREKNIAAKNPVHFTTNRHGTQYQGIPFNLSKEELAFPTSDTRRLRPLKNEEPIDIAEEMPEYPILKIKNLSREELNRFYTLVYLNEDRHTDCNSPTHFKK
ncbi:hypothetical protein [Erwinia piriflorinigrans]|uniref:hypothetical protein n=1 Tax=Erwinia piriflorinigrans TaxID=665097 RepID=UPI0006605A55|nr:hypothetical protein [Erwinia piriflorinigrans]